MDNFCQPVIGPVPSGGEDLLEGVRRFLNRVVHPEKRGEFELVVLVLVLVLVAHPEKRREYKLVVMGAPSYLSMLPSSMSLISFLIWMRASQNLKTVDR